MNKICEDGIRMVKGQLGVHEQEAFQGQEVLPLDSEGLVNILNATKLKQVLKISSEYLKKLELSSDEPGSDSIGRILTKLTSKMAVRIKIEDVWSARKNFVIYNIEMMGYWDDVVKPNWVYGGDILDMASKIKMGEVRKQIIIYAVHDGFVYIYEDENQNTSIVQTVQQDQDFEYYRVASWNCKGLTIAKAAWAVDQSLPQIVLFQDVKEFIKGEDFSEMGTYRIYYKRKYQNGQMDNNVRGLAIMVQRTMTVERVAEEEIQQEGVECMLMITRGLIRNIVIINLYVERTIKFQPVIAFTNRWMEGIIKKYRDSHFILVGGDLKWFSGFQPVCRKRDPTYSSREGKNVISPWDMLTLIDRSYWQDFEVIKSPNKLNYLRGEVKVPKREQYRQNFPDKARAHGIVDRAENFNELVSEIRSTVTIFREYDVPQNTIPVQIEDKENIIQQFKEEFERFSDSNKWHFSTKTSYDLRKHRHGVVEMLRKDGKIIVTTEKIEGAVIRYIGGIQNMEMRTVEFVDKLKNNAIVLPQLGQAELFSLKELMSQNRAISYSGISYKAFQKDSIVGSCGNIWNTEYLMDNVREFGRCRMIPLQTMVGIHTMGDMRPAVVMGAEVTFLEMRFYRKLQQMADKVVDDRQAGFMKGRSVKTNLMRLDVMKQIYQGKYLVFLEFKRAFNHVNLSRLWQVLIRDNRQGNWFDQNEIIFMMWIREALYFKDEAGQDVIFQRGLMSSSVLSPLLFNIYMNDIMKRLVGTWCEDYCAYADDVVMVMNEKQLEQLAEVREIFLEYNMTIINVRSGIMRLEETKDNKQRVDKLDFREKYMFMGVLVGKEVGFARQIAKINLATIWMARYIKTQMQTFSFNFMMWNTRIKPLIMYTYMAVEKEDELKRLEKLYHKTFKVAVANLGYHQIKAILGDFTEHKKSLLNEMQTENGVLFSQCEIDVKRDILTFVENCYGRQINEMDIIMSVDQLKECNVCGLDKNPFLHQLEHCGMTVDQYEQILTHENLGAEKKQEFLNMLKKTYSRLYGQNRRLEQGKMGLTDQQWEDETKQEQSDLQKKYTELSAGDMQVIQQDIELPLQGILNPKQNALHQKKVVSWE